MNSNLIPDLLLERYVLKELDGNTMTSIRELSERDPVLAARINELKVSNRRILNDYPEDKITAEIMHKFRMRNQASAKRRLNPLKHLRIMAPAAIAVAAIVVITLPSINNDVTIVNPNEITRQKGKEASIYIYRKNRNNEIDIMKDGAGAKAGDLLQIGYSSLKDAYGVILSIDGRGKVTLHYPADEKAQAKLITGKKHLLENSYELDDAPDFERFFFITSPDEIKIESIIFSAELLAVEREKARIGNMEFSDPAKKSLKQVSVLINKDQIK